jgi:crossover junction endodeoxyribonuclease RuvC
MKILGIDPGTATSGYGMLEINKDNGFEVIDFGLIETGKDDKPEIRLHSIHLQLGRIIDEHNPEVIAIEKLFFFRNAKTVMRVGQALGVMLFCAAQKKTDVVEYAPARIKKVISGNGRADKKEMQRSLRKILGPGVRSRKYKKTHFDNAADGLAVALCHAYHLNGNAVKKYEK